MKTQDTTQALNWSEIPDLLPNKPSELIIKALEDLEAAEQADAVTINMAVWHQPTPVLSPTGDVTGMICQMCFAGAVMSGLGVRKEVNADPSGFDSQTLQRKLCALNEARAGTFKDLFHSCGLPSELAYMFHRIVPTYDSAPEPFKAALRSAAERMAAQGY